MVRLFETTATGNKGANVPGGVFMATVSWAESCTPNVTEPGVLEQLVATSSKEIGRSQRVFIAVKVALC
ncbi:hypothetical protein GCM10022406_18180 [Hymenobacter algoricola]|uniref:Uncharacterized protein n=1 Tax=Hymenobacter algoricola TaxID=486267 RepID=A0ABP7N154_9BACT